MQRGKRLDLTDQVFGWMYVMDRAPRGNSYDARYYCRCFHPKLAPEQGPCGKIRIVYALALKAKKEATQSCGNHGLQGSPPIHGYSHDNRAGTYNSWIGSKGRSFNKDDKSYHRYGGYGRGMCKGLRNSFEHFLKVLGECPEGMSIHRTDNSKGYTCGCCEECKKKGWKLNVEWATSKKQCEPGNRLPKGTFS